MKIFNRSGDSKVNRMSTNERLSQKEKELIAVGVPVAVGCQPCTTHHFKAVREAGVTEAEIRQAVDDALCVRNNATKIMTGLAEKHLGNGSEAKEPCCSEKSLIGELVSIGTALAVNCTTNLETHLQAARTAGATDHQIQTALGIARNIKKVAGEKAEAAVKAATQPGASVETEAAGGCDDDCGCNDDNGSKAGSIVQENTKQERVPAVADAAQPCGCG